MNQPELPSAEFKALHDRLYRLADVWERSGNKARMRCARDLYRAMAVAS